jgi:L-fucose isomerase-like protein
MKKIAACFAASRYFGDRAELERVYGELCMGLQSIATDCRLIVDGQGVDELPAQADALLIIVPMSGAVQKDILRAAERFAAVVLYGAYILGNVSDSASALMVKNNAAPTLMDSWSVLRKRHARALLALNAAELSRRVRLIAAYGELQGKKLILIGEPEPWVISVSRNLDDYRKLGITVTQVAQQEVADLYARMTEADAKPYFDKYRGGAAACVEPTESDLMNAARMTAALVQTLENHQADGMAIACFNLLSLGTTSCIGVSYINDCTDKIAACEGDLDSAITMLMVKQLTDTKVWMANPGLHPQGVVNFSHCTAPLAVNGVCDCPYTLRSHHESGIGASLQVEMPSGVRLSACRVSGAWGTFTAQGATGETGPREECCRTQLYVRFDDFDRYLQTALGCHQVFCFEDVTADFTTLARWLGFTPEMP